MRFHGRTCGIVLLVMTCACTSGPQWSQLLPPVESLPWPAEPAPLPACVAAPAAAAVAAVSLDFDPTRSQLPVWELTVDPARLAEIHATPHADRHVEARLRVDGVERPARVRLHGGTSRDFAKKSFRIDLARGQEVDGRRHLILRGEWNDKSLLRTYLGYELFRHATWLPTPDASFVHVRLNDEFYGVMLHVERIDRDFLRARALDPAGPLIEADPPLGGDFGDLAPMTPDAYEAVYDVKGDGTLDPLRDLVERVLASTPSAFAAEAPEVIAVDDVLVYLAAMAVLQNHDHVRKNYYLYRPSASNGRWMVLPWDLDLTFGHMWTPAEDVLGEAIVTDADPFAGATLRGPGQRNVLTERLLGIPALRARMLQMARRIAARAAAPGFLDARLAHVRCLAGPDILADPRKRATNDEYAGRVEEIREFMARRRAFLDRVE